MQSASNVIALRDSDAILPDPILPPDVDLTGFHYLPISPDRLSNSPDWRRAKREPLHGFRFVSLLIATFRQNPAGSLPNDDQALADILGVSDEQWAEIKEPTLRTWTLCSDGRWHHELAAHAIGLAWDKHSSNLRRTDGANKARAVRHAQRDVQRDVDVTSHQGEKGYKGEETKETNQTKTVEAANAASSLQERATRLPSDWQPDRAYAREKGLRSREIDHEVEKFRN